MSWRRKCLSWLVLLFFFANVAVAEKVEGTLHGPHTKCSDGTWLPEAGTARAELAGSQFVGPADHYMRLVVPWNQTMTRALLAIYYQGFKTNRLPVILGAEFSAKHGKETSDIVAYRTKPVAADDRLTELIGKADIQQELFDRLKALGYVTIAAHPHKSGNLFDWTKMQGLDAVEFGNDGTKAAEWQTFSDYLQLLHKGWKLAVTGGCDSHSPLDPLDLARWGNKTGADIDGKPTAASVVEAIRTGRTWFARKGIKLVSLNYRPSFTPHQVKGLVQFRLDLSTKAKKSPQVQIYRDSVLTASIGGKAIGKGTYRYSWNDPKVTKGSHYYNLVAGDLDLVTSPIYLEVTPTPATTRIAVAKSQQVAGNLKGRLPLFRGMSEAEVRRLFGKPSKVYMTYGRLDMLLFVSSPAGYQTEVFFDYSSKPLVRMVQTVFRLDPKSPLIRTASAFLPEMILAEPISSRRLGYDPDENILIMVGNIGDRYFKVAVTHPTKKVWRSIYRPGPGAGGRLREDIVAVDWKTCKVLKYYETEAGIVVEYPGLGIGPPR